MKKNLFKLRLNAIILCCLVIAFVVLNWQNNDVIDDKNSAKISVDSIKEDAQLALENGIAAHQMENKDLVSEKELEISEIQQEGSHANPLQQKKTKQHQTYKLPQLLNDLQERLTNILSLEPDHTTATNNRFMFDYVATNDRIANNGFHIVDYGCGGSKCLILVEKNDEVQPTNAQQITQIEDKLIATFFVGKSEQNKYLNRISNSRVYQDGKLYVALTFSVSQY